jgi:DNA-binding transcriptional MerR regulator
MYYSREELAEKARMEGMDVSERTIRYWEYLGLLPRAQRQGQCVYHHESVLSMMRIIYTLKNDLGAVVRRHKNELYKILFTKEGVMLDE